MWAVPPRTSKKLLVVGGLTPFAAYSRAGHWHATEWTGLKVPAVTGGVIDRAVVAI
jgi:hypothetical protein